MATVTAPNQSSVRTPPRPVAPPQGPPPGVPSTTPPARTKSRLASVVRGQLRSSLRMMFYGPEGVGKTSLVADAPKPILIDVEGGADNVDTTRYQFRDEVGGHKPLTYAEFLTAIEDLIANPGHGYETLGIDTLDALEALLHAHVCKENGKASIEDFGFGKGYIAALDEWRRLIARLDVLRAQGVQVVLIGHSVVRTFKDPVGEDYDRYQLRVHDKAAGLLKEWCDIVGFMHFEGGSSKLKGDSAQTKRARGWTSGRRLVQFAREAAWDAKSRLRIHAEVELDTAHPWHPIALASMGARDDDSRTLTEVVLAELDRIGADTFVTAAGRETSRQAVLDLVAKSDASTLSRIVAGLQATAAANVTAATKES